MLWLQVFSPKRNWLSWPLHFISLRRLHWIHWQVFTFLSWQDRYHLSGYCLGRLQTRETRASVPFAMSREIPELCSKARARNSRSRDRTRRRSRDRGCDTNRGRDANPPFSIFPQAEANDSSSSLRLTPNTGHDQDLTTWRHIVDEEPPQLQLLDDTPNHRPVPVLHHWQWPFIQIEAFNMTCTVHHPGMNRISSTNWFNRFTIQNNNIKQLHHHSTFNFALNPDNFIHHPTAVPYQNPEISVPWLPLHHPENVKIIVPPIFLSQNFSDLIKNTRRRFGVHLPETHQKLVLQTIDGAIHFRKGKTIGRVRPFRAFSTIGFPYSTNSTNLVFWHQAHRCTMPWTILQTYLCEAPFTDGCHMQSQGSYSKLVWWNSSDLYLLYFETVPFGPGFPQPQVWTLGSWRRSFGTSTTW